MILLLMVGWLFGLATGDVNMSPVMVLDHFGVHGGGPGGPCVSLSGSLGGPWGSSGRSLGVPGGSLGAPGAAHGSLGGSLGIPGVSQVPGRSLGVRGRRLGVPGGSLGVPAPPPGTPIASPGASLEASVGAMSTLKNIQKTEVFIAFPSIGQT